VSYGGAYGGAYGARYGATYTQAAPAPQGTVSPVPQ